MVTIRKNCLAWVWVLVLVVGCIWPKSVPAEQTNIFREPSDSALSQEVENGLSYLLELVQKKEAAFDPARIVALIDFTAQGGSDARKLLPAERTSGYGACLRADIKAPLERILRYAYNPRIPSYVVYPRVIRLSGWYPGSDLVTRDVKLWKKLTTIDKPLLLWGKEYEVNTPDAFSGAYYRYDLNRLIILMKHNNKKVLVTVSKMPAPSGVGKKAVIIDDDNWNYFYSGIKGLTLKLLGPMETYIQDSASVQIMYETDSVRPRTRMMLFKWLKAGWGNLNLVRHRHIYEGGLRFVKGLKETMESNSLPDPGVLVQGVKYITALPEAKIDAKIRKYSHNFERIAQKHQDMSPQEFVHIIEGGGYGKALNREERLGVLTLEYFKSQLGKTALVEFHFRPLSENIIAKPGKDVVLSGASDSL